MNIDEIIKLHESINSKDMEGSAKVLSELNDALYKYAEEGSKIIVERMRESDYAKVRSAIIVALASKIVVDCGAKGLALALLEDSLVLYTDTFFTAMLGFLAENEVL